ncbi:MAG: DUF4124 domain-containing protein [Burkholderiaceae bacterium]
MGLRLFHISLLERESQLITTRKLTILFICAPLFAYAQVYKCKQPDGSTTFQDQECPSGATSSQIESKSKNTHPTSESLQKFGLDASCQQELNSAANNCGPTLDVALKQCLREKLSSPCWDQIAAPPSVKRDSACMQEAQAANCIPQATLATQQCMQRTLSAKCNQQRMTAEARIEKSRTACDPQINRWREEVRSCGDKGKTQDEQWKCISQVQKPVCDQ